MKKKITTFIVIALCISLASICIVQAAEQLPYEIDLPQIPQIPRHLVANGTYFEINDSEYLNITAMSSDPVKIILRSIPEIVSMHIEPTYMDTSTRMTLGGFSPQTTYRKYEDDYDNFTTFTTDTKGTYTYIQNLSKPHFVVIRPVLNPMYLPPGTIVRLINDNETGGDCSCIGNWDPDTKTCTLTTDLNETIQIDSDNITLDGDGYTLWGNGTGYGVYADSKKGLIIKNIEIINHSNGIHA